MRLETDDVDVDAIRTAFDIGMRDRWAFSGTFPRLMVEMGQPGIDRSIVHVIRDVFKVEEAKMPWMQTRWRENIAVDVKDRIERTQDGASTQ
jgi:hypothetical protein